MAQIAADPALAAGIRDYTDPTTTAQPKRQLGAGHRQPPAECPRAGEVLHPIIAAANGYNVILAHNSTRSGSYIVTLNRAATTVCSQTNDNARPGMRNW